MLVTRRAPTSCPRHRNGVYKWKNCSCFHPCSFFFFFISSHHHLCICFVFVVSIFICALIFFIIIFFIALNLYVLLSLTWFSEIDWRQFCKTQRRKCCSAGIDHLCGTVMFCYRQDARSPHSRIWDRSRPLHIHNVLQCHAMSAQLSNFNNFIYYVAYLF